MSADNFIHVVKQGGRYSAHMDFASDDDCVGLYPYFDTDDIRQVPLLAIQAERSEAVVEYGVVFDDDVVADMETTS